MRTTLTFYVLYWMFFYIERGEAVNGKFLQDILRFLLRLVQTFKIMFTGQLMCSVVQKVCRGTGLL